MGKKLIDKPDEYNIKGNYPLFVPICLGCEQYIKDVSGAKQVEKKEILQQVGRMYINQKTKKEEGEYMLWLNKTQLQKLKDTDIYKNRITNRRKTKKSNVGYVCNESCLEYLRLKKC